MRFSEFSDINPKIKLSKGKEYPCIEMENILAGNRYVKACKEKVFSGGGSKFETGDILFARITPCLENGKIAQYKGNDHVDGFGSTEFFVFRAKKGISDSGFLFYLAYSDILRTPAEGSMFGASGRQRAALDVVKSTIVPDISLDNQRKISSTLSAYDDLLENNSQRIHMLEEIAQRIYREWFVDFRFPGYEKARFVKSELGKIPEGWQVSSLGESCFIIMGQSPKSEFYNENKNGLPFHQGVTDFGKIFPKVRIYCTVQNRIAEAGDILFSVRAPVGRINLCNDRIVIGRGLSAIRSKSGNQVFILLQLKDRFKEEDSIGGGTIFKSVTKDDMHSIKIVLPPSPMVLSFEKITNPIVGELKNLTIQNLNLKTTRDILLPKLIAGEVDMSKLNTLIPGQSNVA